MKTPKQSPVVAFIQAVWDNTKAGSWETLNHSLAGALRIAIDAGFKFEQADFLAIFRRFNGSRWFGTDPDGKGFGTGFYSLAVAVSNMSACQSFEAWNGYPPYLWLGRRLAVGGYYKCEDVGLVVIPPKWKDIAPGSLTMHKTDDQLIEQLQFRYADKWWVTGFGSETIRLANYYGDDNKGGRRTGKPKKLMKLTREELAEMSKVLRAAMRPVKEKGSK